MRSFAGIVAPGAVAVAGMAALLLWSSPRLTSRLDARIPGMDKAPEAIPPGQRPLPTIGEPVASDGVPSELSGAWPWFRGQNLDAICDDGIRLARKWPRGGPRKLWTVEMGYGYAAAAVRAGCVYVLDYDEQAEADTMRCLSLEDGKEIWRNSYPVEVANHHGMSRTIPAVIGEQVISLGPRCHVACWDAKTGEGRWILDLVRDFGAMVPQWYAGQCPMIDVDADRLILAPGGEALLMAVDYNSGEVLWKSPNPRAWVMTHSSVVPMEFAGKRMYVYCGKGGVAGVSAEDGSILWDTTAWKNSTAMCPSPVILPEGKIFCSGGYGAIGAVILQLKQQDGRITCETLRRVKLREFASEQQTPVLFDGHLYGVRKKDGKLLCLDLKGDEVWNSGEDDFGDGPYMIAGGLIYAMDDYGRLTMAEATHKGYRPLGSAQVIKDANESWGPMALASGRLIVRDMTRMVCLHVAEE